MNLTEPIKSFYVHFVGYRKFTANVYRKFTIDLWNDVCGWLAGKEKAPLLDFSLGRVFNNSDTNLKHNCPFSGHLYAKADNVSLSNFVVEHLLPSGRYRIETTFTNGRYGPWLAKVNTFISISDHRVEIF